MPEVIVYTQPNCPNCLAEKRFLRGLGVRFQERDITSDSAAAEELRRNKIRTTPATAIKGEFVAGFRPNRLMELIGRMQD